MVLVVNGWLEEIVFISVFAFLSQLAYTHTYTLACINIWKSLQQHKKAKQLTWLSINFSNPSHLLKKKISEILSSTLKIMSVSPARIPRCKTICPHHRFSAGKDNKDVFLAICFSSSECFDLSLRFAAQKVECLNTKIVKWNKKIKIPNRENICHHYNFRPRTLTLTTLAS